MKKKEVKGSILPQIQGLPIPGPDIVEHSLLSSGHSVLKVTRLRLP